MEDLTAANEGDLFLLINDPLPVIQQSSPKGVTVNHLGLLALRTWAGKRTYTVRKGSITAVMYILSWQQVVRT